MNFYSPSVLKKYTADFKEMTEKVAADASSLHLTAFTSGESEKDSEMQMGAKPIDCIIYGAARELKIPTLSREFLVT